MLISHRNRFIFTKTIKTAGTSVEVFFEKYCFPDGEWEYKHLRDEYQGPTGIVGYRGFAPDSAIFRNHMPAEKIREIVGDEIWKDYFKFTVVRNPFDRLVSAFYHFEKSRNRTKYVDDDKSDIQRFREWILSGGNSIDRSAYLIKGQICMDYFIRFESLETGVRSVCERLGVPFDTSELRNLKSDFRDNRYRIDEFYDSESRELVENVFSFELENFGYQLPAAAVNQKQ